MMYRLCCSSDPSMQHRGYGQHVIMLENQTEKSWWDTLSCVKCTVPFLPVLRSQSLLFQLRQNQRAPIGSQFGCEFLAGVWYRNADSETKPYYFCKPWLAVETATAAFYLICLLFPFYIPLHLDINKASRFAVYVLQGNMLTIITHPIFY